MMLGTGYTHNIYISLEQRLYKVEASSTVRATLSKEAVWCLSAAPLFADSILGFLHLEKPYCSEYETLGLPNYVSLASSPPLCLPSLFFLFPLPFSPDLCVFFLLFFSRPRSVFECLISTCKALRLFINHINKERKEKKKKINQKKRKGEKRREKAGHGFIYLKTWS